MGKPLWTGDGFIVTINEDRQVEVDAPKQLRPYQALQLANALTQASQFLLCHQNTAA